MSQEKKEIKPEIFEKYLGEVSEIVTDQLDVEADLVKAEASFANDLGADSLDTVELVMALEEKFDIEIPDEAAEKIDTVGKAVEHIVRDLGKPEFFK